ncbi:karyopherin [Blastocladiella emersonii ATCC 22665]|nr:karyopherin [Blastocladiella emersonii ATCC 22665]
MTLPGNVLGEIIQAIRVQLSPTASQAERLQTYEYLNKVTQSGDAPAVGMALAPAGAGHPDEVRFFGLKCLEFVARYQWAQMPPEAGSAFVGSLEQLVTEGLAPSDSNPIKSKLATILVEVAKREWPQPWDLNALLTRMFTGSLIHRELVFMTLTALCEDIYDVDFSDEVVVSRKRVLMKALSSIVLTDEAYAKQVHRDLQPFRNAVKVVEYVPGEQGRLGWYLVAVTQLQPFVSAGFAATPADVHMGVAALRALATMVSWVSSELLAQSNLLVGLAQLLAAASSSALRYAAAEVLFLVCHRNYPQPGEAQLMFEPFVDGGLVTPVVQCLYSLDQGDAEAFDTMKLLVQAIVEVGTRQVCGKTNTAWLPRAMPEYISALLELQQHPSVTLSTSIVSFWLTALKHPYLKQSEPILDALPRVLEKAILTFERPPPYEEFPNRKTRSRALASLKAHTKTVVKLVAGMSPMQSAQWLLTQLVAGTHVAGAQAMIEASSSELLKDPVSLLQLYQHLLTRVRAAADARQDDTLASLVRTASACVGAIGGEMQLLLPLLETIITYSTPSRGARYTLLAQMARIATAVPDLVFALADEIHRAATALPLPEVCHVVECQLVAILHTAQLPNPADRAARTRALFDPILSGFCADVAAALPDPAALIRLCDPAVPANREMRSRIMLPMVTLNAGMKRAAASSYPDVLDVYVPQVAACVMQIVQCAHALTDPGLAQTNPLVKMLQDVPVYIKTAYLQTKESEDSAAAAANPTAPPTADAEKAKLKVQMWVEQLKPNAYTLLGHLLRPAFYQIPDVAAHIIRTVFANLDTVESRHLTAVLRCFVEPLVSNCPDAARPAVLLPVIPALCRFLIARLDREWAANALATGADGQWRTAADVEEEEGGGSDDDEDESGTGAALSAEIVHDRQLRALSVGALDMLASWFVQGRKRRVENGLAEAVFGDATLHEAVLSLLTAACKWGEPSAVTKSMITIKALLPHFAPPGTAAAEARATRIPILASFVVRGVLPALRSPVHADAYDIVLGMISGALVILLASEFANDTLQMLAAEGVPQQALMLFHQTWPQLHTEGDRERAIKSLFAHITSVAVGEAGRIQKSTAVAMVNKVMIAPQAGGAGGAGGGDDEPDFGDLFDETNALDHAI